MNGGSTPSGIAVEKLVGNNYNYWKLCMEAFLQGQNLWDLIEGDETSISADTSQNAELWRKWKIKCGKALLALRILISKEYIDHEALLNQMTSNNKLSPKSEDMLYVKDHSRKNVHSKSLSSNKNQFRTEDQSKRPSKACYRCGKLGHLKRDCRVKVVYDRCKRSGHIKANCRVKMQEIEANVVNDINEPQKPTKDEWIVDSGCSYHATGNDYILSDIRLHREKKVIVTVDNSLHPVMKEGDLNDGGVFLKDVYHVPGLKKNLGSISQITDSG
ncbi:hypothetical protein Salat_1462800, partial [Sesamum alatum]